MSYVSDALIDAQEREIKKLKTENAKLRALCHDMYLVVACLDLDRTRLQRHGKDADWRTLEERYEELRAEVGA